MQNEKDFVIYVFMYLFILLFKFMLFSSSHEIQLT